MRQVDAGAQRAFVGFRLLAEQAIVAAVGQLFADPRYGGERRPVLRGGLAPVLRRRLVEHIEASLDQTITLKDLAKLADLSEFHLQRMFRASCGVSPHDFILNRRIDRARRMLEGSEPIAQIAPACGFSSQSHLTRMFKAVTGTQPVAEGSITASPARDWCAKGIATGLAPDVPGPDARLGVGGLAALPSRGDGGALGGRACPVRVTIPASALRTRLQPERWREARADLYLSLPQSDWAAWVPASLLAQWRLERLQAGGEVWLSWAEGAVQRAVSRLHAPQLQAGYGPRESVALSNLSLNAYFTRTAEGSEVLFDDLAFSRGEQRWGEARVALRQQAGSAELQEQWLLSADYLDLAPLQPLVAALAPMPDKALAVLAQLSPKGAVRNLQLDYRPQVEGPGRLQFSANLERIGFAAYLASPAAENVSGSISGDLAQGELRMASENFSLHLDTLFPQPWRYSTANARLTWQLDEQAFTLRSPYLQVVGEEGAIAGDFLIRLIRDPLAEDYMDLRVGLRDGDARFTEKYLPSRAPGMSAELDHWLKTAIRAGHVEEGYFQYQGSIRKGDPREAHSMSLFFRVSDAELAFQPGWPSLREGRADVLIEPDLEDVYFREIGRGSSAVAA